MVTDQLSEQEIQFRKRARRRLIGAIALVLLMVTVLPMVLDERESKVAPPEIAISIPSQDGADFSSRIVPTPPAPPASVPVPAPAPADKAAPAKKQAALPAAPVVPAKADEFVSPSVGEEQKPAEEQISVKKPKATPTADKPTSSALPAKEQQQAAAADKSTADKPSSKKGSFSVQIGVLSASANIKQLQAKVTAQELQSYTENLATPKGTMIRVRVGPFANRVEAEQAYEKLKAAGLNGIIVTNK